MNLRFTLTVGTILAASSAYLCFSQTSDKQQRFADHMQRAQEYLHDRRPELALPELLVAVDADPENVDAQANAGVLLYFQHKPVDAIPHLRVAVERHPSLAKIQGLLGLAELQSSEAPQGRHDLEAAFPQIDEPKFKVQVGLELVGIYTQAGDLHKAPPVLAELVKSFPREPEVLYAAYRTYTDLAAESMLALSLAAPDSAQMHQMMAHEEIRIGKTNEAIAQLRQAIRINPHLPGIHFELAELLHTTANEAIEKQAEQEYLESLDENPHDEKALCRLGEINAVRGDFDRARDEFSQAIKLQPMDADAKFGLANALIELNHADEALPLLEESARDEPTNALVHYRLATLYDKLGRKGDAKREIDIFRKLKEAKNKLRAQYKDLVMQPEEILQDSKNEK